MRSAITSRNNWIGKEFKLIKELTKEKNVLEYEDDKPCPSLLMLGFIGSRPIHVLAALCEQHVRIITTYEPETAKWTNFRLRKEERR